MKLSLISLCSIALFIASTPSYAKPQSGQFIINRATPLLSTHVNSNYKIEFELFKRANSEQPWQSQGTSEICFSSIPKEDCYDWVGILEMITYVPRDLSDKFETHAYKIGFGFTEPDANDGVRINESHSHERSFGNGDPWKPVFPNFKGVLHNEKLGEWSTLEFSMAADDHMHLRARLVKSGELK